MAYIFLIISAIGEVIATITLEEYSKGDSKLYPTLVLIVAELIAFY